MHRYLSSTSARAQCNFLYRRNETKLAARLCSGQPAAWAQLIDRWSPRLYSYIFYNVGDETEARKLMHVILSEMIQTVIGSPRINNLSILIFSIAHRHVLRYHRQNSAPLCKQWPLEQPTRTSLAEINYDRGTFFHRFRQFSAETQQILLLRFVCGVSIVELSQIVEQSEEVLVQTIHQVKFYLQ
jgi:DNA-directed RNA polymerase specialized sigma24 family protein